MIYLDNSATTQPYDEVIEAFRKTALDYYANPSSLHRKGGEVERLVRQARGSIASLLQIDSDEVVFTSGGTESNNLAIKGTAFEHMNRGKHLITSQIEHASCMESFRQLEKMGFNVTYLPVGSDGQVSKSDLAEALTKDTILVSLMHVNNEVGSIQPIKELGTIIKENSRALFHIDDVQGIGKVSLPIPDTVDLVSYSAHKFHGLKGNGLLYKRRNVSLFPLLSGGGQEKEVRSGTENVPGIVATAKALRLYLQQSQSNSEKLHHLKSKLQNELGAINEVVINTPRNSAPHITNFSIPGIKPEVLIHALEEKDIFVSTRSACSSKTAEPSHVLTALGVSNARARSAIRISLSFQSTEKEIEVFLVELKKAIHKLKQVMRY
ncbi:cysteine desulfurase family protein [Guptibacillus algicola]|uniref:cysteine desulfurase family protein n=1 Tax=Guptibacillus algicola TaxID=225844 RepID=UPI001CD6BCC9|nr:cysteine desulfurase family protein [Alkalihalobacillus algicola]MCA0986370.1 cysteine desulfurase [Alkalihalobacillus algicola]